MASKRPSPKKVTKHLRAVRSGGATAPGLDKMRKSSSLKNKRKGVYRKP